MSPALCGFCQDSFAETFCEADDAFLCSSCDHRVHSANKLASRHRRNPLCHACKRAPASLKPSSLCRTCDKSPIPPDHLSSRHFRTPTPAFVEIPKPNPNPNPNTNTNHSPSPSPNPDRVINCLKYEPGPGPPPCIPLRPAGDVSSVVPDLCHDERDGESVLEEESVAWLFSDHAKNMDKDLGFFEENFLLSNIFTHCDQNRKERDCVVPVVISPFPPPKQDDTFTNHSISSSSLDTGLVPDATTVSETSTILRPVDPVPIFDPLDREARVLRYKEKRKNRQFTKTIRYASRKAYAEARPRIKGRFVKQPAAATATEASFTWLMQDESGFGVVPSF